jgi:hypothetical protein
MNVDAIVMEASRTNTTASLAGMLKWEMHDTTMLKIHADNDPSAGNIQ